MMGDMYHSCNANPTAGKVCSHLATDGLLTYMGYPVKVTQTCVGAVRVVREGTSHEKAVMLAWADRKVRLCHRTR